MGRAINPVRRCSLFGATTMLTLRQSPFDLFERLEQQIATAERVSNAEVVETENGYVVRLELPGVQRNSIDIEATDRNLEITANFRDGILEITAGKAVNHNSVTVQLED